MTRLDPNLTTPIILNATLNGNLIQPSQSLFSNSSLSVILGVVIGWLLNYLSSTIQENKKFKVETLQKKKQIYSEFKGIAYLIPQLFATQYGTLTRHYWIAFQNGKRRNLSNNIYEDFEQYHINSEMEIAKVVKNLSEIIGLVQVSFLPRLELDNLIENLYSEIKECKLTNTEIRNKFHTATENEIDSLDENIKKLKEITNSITESMNEIEEYLKREIDKVNIK